jgi:hypothetical protein
MLYECFERLAFSIALLGVVMLHSVSVQANDLTSSATQAGKNSSVILSNGSGWLNPQPEPPGSRGGGSHD